MKTALPILFGILATSMALRAAPRPNIILCMADDMGWGDPGYNSRTITLADGTPHPDQGWINTPTLDTMAANGLRFDRFYAASAVCSPTRASCLTGRNPFRVGVPTANAGRLGFDETPLSEVLSAQGYQCGHFGKCHLGSLTTLRNDSNRGGNASVYSGPWHHGYDFCFCTESKVPTHHPCRRASNALSLPVSFGDPNWYGTYYWRMPSNWNQSSGEGEIVPVVEVNNGIGIKTSGAGALALAVEETPLVIPSFGRGPGPNDATLRWSSVPGVQYRIEANDNLTGPWEFIDVATGAAGRSTTYINVGGMTDLESRCYRIAFPHN